MSVISLSWFKESGVVYIFLKILVRRKNLKLLLLNLIKNVRELKLFKILV